MLERRVLEMTWRDGLFCHWPVDPAVVSGTLPDRLSVATHGGDAYLSVVAFVMDDIRPRGAPVGLSFPELNLRTYVEGPDGPGVYFYNLDADDRIGVELARRLFALPYYRAEMDVSHPATANAPSAPKARVAPFGSPAAGLTPAFLTHGSTRPTSRRARRSPLSRDRSTRSSSRTTGSMPRGTGCTAVRSRTSRGRFGRRPSISGRTRCSRRTGFDRPDGDPIVRYAEPIDVSADRIRSVC